MSRTRMWTDEEVEYLVDNYQSMKYAEIAKHLDTNSNRVKKKLHALGLFKDYTQKVWSEDELKQLRSDMPFMTSAQLSRKYCCTYGEITKQKNRLARELGTDKPPKIQRHKAVYSNPDYTKLLDKYAPM